MTNRSTESAQIEDQLDQPLPIARMLFSQGMTAIALVLTALALLPLLSVLIEILRQGISRR